MNQQQKERMLARNFARAVVNHMTDIEKKERFEVLYGMSMEEMDRAQLKGSWAQKAWDALCWTHPKETAEYEWMAQELDYYAAVYNWLEARKEAQMNKQMVSVKFVLDCSTKDVREAVRRVNEELPALFDGLNVQMSKVRFDAVNEGEVSKAEVLQRAAWVGDMLVRFDWED